MPVISFKEWVPDAADLGNPGSPEIKNAVPSITSYKPFNQLVTTTDALDAYPRGAIEAKDSSQNTYQYAGDAAKLYRLVSNVWTDSSKGGGYSTATEERWEFARWKQQVIATNYSDDPQVITLGGTQFADLTTALQFRHVAVVRDYVVAGNTNDGVDGAVPDRVRWSAFNDATDWTVSPVTGADFRDLKKGGEIQRIIGGDFGIIVSEQSTWRMSFVGSPTFFVIDEIGPGIGALAPGSVALLGDTVFIWSEHGMMALKGGGNPQPIGNGRVDQFLRNDLDEDYAYRISSVADPQSGLVMWAYPGAGNTSGRPNKIVVFDTQTNKWGYIETDVNLIWRSGGVATTLDGLDDVNLGSELVSTGDFASDTNWTKGTGWTIAAGVASHAAGSASSLSQAISITENLYYRVEFDVANRTAGSVSPLLGGTSGTAISADNTDIKETIRAGSGGSIAFSATSDFDGDIDNVSVKLINDIDSMSISLDDSQWKGGSPLLAGFDTSFQNGNFSGSPMTAVLTTKELELNPGRVTRLRHFDPLVDGGTVTAEVGERNRQSDAATFGASLTQRDSGRFTTRSNAKFHRFRLTVSGDWTDAIGVRVEGAQARPSRRRG